MSQLDELVGRVEALLALLPVSSNPEVDAVRDRVDGGIFEAWTSIALDSTESSGGAPIWILMGLVFIIATATSFVVLRADELRT